MADKATDSKAVTGSASRRAAKRAARPVWKRRLFATLKGLGIAVLALALIGIGGVVYAYNTTDFPDPNAAFQTNKSTVFYRDGTTQLGTFADQNRTSIPYAQMPQDIKDAVVAAENRTFWTDRGISITGILRSVWHIARGGDMQGGSTITQQYIKIMYLTSDQTVTRKAKELLLAVKMGRSMPKEQILEGYLNTIYFGRGAYGIQAASKAYFNIDAKDLTVPQAAVLASVLNNPGMFDPSEGQNNADRLLTRYQYVLDGMLEAGNITQAEHDQFYNKLPDFPEVPKSQRYGGPNGFLLKMVQQELLANGFSDADINGGGLQIVTTFDAEAQAAAIASAQKYTEQSASQAAKKQDPAQLHAALASVEVGTGEVLALYGGPDYLKSSRNWATTDRMAASTFKTYAVIAGLRNGFSLRSTLNGNTFTPRGDSTPIRNEFSMQYGTVTLTKATADSINTAFVDMVQQIQDGPNKVIQAANDAGVPKGAGWDANNRIPLGMAEVSPLDQATGYATIANKGAYVPSHVVKTVKTTSGEVRYDSTRDDALKAQQRIDEPITRDVTYALQNVVNEGTGARVQSLNRDIAGKTGTAGVGDDVVSSWFVAYTKQVSTAVMYVAGDTGLADLDPYARQGDSTFFGGTYPALTWLDYMKVAMANRPAESFDPPAYVNGNARSSATARPTTAAPSSAAPSSQAPSSAPATTETTTQAPPPTTTAPPTSAAPPPTTRATTATQRPSAPATSGAPPSAAPSS